MPVSKDFLFFFFLAQVGCHRKQTSVSPALVHPNISTYFTLLSTWILSYPVIRNHLSNVLIHLVKCITGSLKLCATFFVYTFFSEEHSLLLCSPQRTLWPEKNNGSVSILQKGLKLTVRLIRHITFDVRLCRRTQGRGQIHYRAVSAVSPQLE